MLLIVLMFGIVSSTYSLHCFEQAVHTTKANSCITLKTCDGRLFFIDKNRLDSLPVLKNCINDCRDDVPVPVDLSSEEFTIFDRCSADHTLLQTYTFDELLIILRCLEYLGDDTLKPEVKKHVALGLTCSSSKGMNHRLPWYENHPHYVMSFLALLFGTLCSYDSDQKIYVFGKAFSLCMVINAFTYLLKRKMQSERMAREDIDTVGSEDLFFDTYFDKTALTKFINEPFHDLVKAEILMPLLKNNRGLRWLICRNRIHDGPNWNCSQENRDLYELLRSTFSSEFLDTLASELITEVGTLKIIKLLP